MHGNRRPHPLQMGKGEGSWARRASMGQWKTDGENYSPNGHGIAAEENCCVTLRQRRNETPHKIVRRSIV
jgi:hypothetical protein